MRVTENSSKAGVHRDVTLWSILPHTHVRGKRWSYDAIYPDGRTATLLSVPDYDFDWQTDYIYKQPIKLPKGTKIHATAWYDNSTANKSNPDPTKDVWWGDQTYEEMMSRQAFHRQRAAGLDAARNRRRCDNPMCARLPSLCSFFF